MLGVALGLSSALAWGIADFLGGLQSRRLPLLAVLLFSQAAGLTGVAVLVALSSGSAPGGDAVLAAALAGISGVIGLAAFYRGLATGTMSIVAPLSATSAAVPVVVGLATGDRPGALQTAGIVAAVIGVVLASQERHEDEERAAAARASVVLAMIAALGFGFFFVGMDSAADDDVLWALLVARGASFPLIVVAVLAMRPGLAAARASLPALLVIGALDVAANGLFAFATTEGLLSVVGVLGGLYPVATVVLARVVLGERVRRVQEGGILLALAGVGLMAGG